MRMKNEHENQQQVKLILAFSHPIAESI